MVFEGITLGDSLAHYLVLRDYINYPRLDIINPRPFKHG